MSFQQGLSGLNAASQSLDIIGNNIANAGTSGFKGASAQFADVFAAALGSGSASQVGIGTQVGAVLQQFTQGNITTTSNSMDMAVNGQGFYRMTDNSGSVLYTRNGQFSVNKDGYIVNAQNNYLTGYPADAQGNIQQGSLPSKVYLDPTPLAPKATSRANLAINLDSRLSAPSLPFDPSILPPDPLTYNSSTSLSLYDTLGNPHIVSFYLVSTNTAAAYTGVWNLWYATDGGTMTQGPDLVFNANGALDTAAMSVLPNSISLDGVTGALPTTFPTPPILDLTGSTQYGANFGVSQVTQDGFPMGRLAGIAVSPTGVIQGRYDNGNTKAIGQIALATFNNPGGLLSLGGNAWQPTSASGQAQLGFPGSGRLGLIQSAAIEESNVDMTRELVNMITQQRAYQASAQSVKTQDQILQTLVNLR